MLKLSDHAKRVSAAFDAAFYSSQFSNRATPRDGLAHYLSTGWTEGLDPTPWFSNDAYLARYRDVSLSGMCPFIHFLVHGCLEGRKVMSADEGRAHLGAIAATIAPFFDVDAYHAQVDGGVRIDDPVRHYLVLGRARGLNPAPWFNVETYLGKYPDVAEAGVDPFWHYLALGRWEGRAASGKIPPQPVLEATRHIVAPHFDAACYLAQLQDPVPPTDPLGHYLTEGWRRRLNPNAWFSTRYYLDTNPDIAAAGIEPFQHFIEHGRAEGRRFAPPATSVSNIFAARAAAVAPGPDFELLQPDLAAAGPPLAKLIAFYLPQYHPIPENDAWWGDGFTDWRNVNRAQPRFWGHLQPRLPRDLGYYDLRDGQTMATQIDLARHAGVHAFCFYYYRFGTRRLLETPVERFLATPEQDFPFCLMWANESWTRTWDGLDRHVLIEQTYDPQDDDALIADLARHMRDPRYLQIDGRPLFFLYRPASLPEPAATIARWRAIFARDHGLEPLIFMAQGFGAEDPVEFGLDGAAEFPPHRFTDGMANLAETMERFDEAFSGSVHAYEDLVQRALSQPPSPYPVIPGVAPGWDNEPRRPGRGMAMIGSSPARFEVWLRGAVARARANPIYGEALVVINAWNEWAEGAYLEPDVYHGSAYLNAVARAVRGVADQTVEEMTGNPGNGEGAQASGACVGFIDVLKPDLASGWVWSPNDPSAAFMVEAVRDGRVIGRALADTYRDDLHRHGKGTGRYGFTIRFDDLCPEDDLPTIVAVLGQRRTVLALPRTTAAPVAAERRESRSPTRVGSDDRLTAEHLRFTAPGPDFEEVDPSILDGVGNHRVAAPPLLFAFYLPQFHAIRENNTFWGEGFTEWRQIARGLPRFPGHQQPRIPRDLGFYTLGDDAAVLDRQAALATAAGIGAFCYYYYWFDGRRVLDRPIEAHLRSDVTMPFLLMWANENWTRTWDGLEAEVLLEQNYRREDEEPLLADLARHFSDPRYVRIEGRPLFIIYNPSRIPDPRATLARWRDSFRRHHGVKPLILMAQTFEMTDPRRDGYDGAIEFPPHKLAAPHPGRPTPDAFAQDYAGRVVAYDDFVDTSLGEPAQDFPLVKTVVPGWDNDARRPGRGFVLEGGSPAKYQAWLTALLRRSMTAPILGTGVVAINAWNEWAEAAYLEPDVYSGGAYLNATARAVRAVLAPPAAVPGRRDGITAILPCYNHAAFLPERIASVLEQTRRPDEILFLDDGSTDDSVEIAERLLARGGIPHRIVVNPRNSGAVFAQWLKGLDLAAHDLVWIAETDDSAERTLLARLASALEREDVMGAFGRIQYIDRDGRSLNDLDRYYEGLHHFDWNRSAVISAFEAFAFDFSVCNVVPNASGLLFRKPVLTAAERERLQAYRFAGDWYFYAKVLRGGALAYCSEATSFFRISAGSASRSSFMTERHLVEHEMVVHDLVQEYGCGTEAVQAHADRLAKLFPAEARVGMTARLHAAASATPRQPLRICIAAHSFAVGGGEVAPLELANALRRRGHHVTYLVLERPDVPAEGLQRRLRRDIPVVYWQDVRADLAGFCRQYGFDVINSHNVGYEIHLHRLGATIPCAYVSSLHGGYETVPEHLTPDFADYVGSLVSGWVYLSDKNLAPLKAIGVDVVYKRLGFNALSEDPVAWADRKSVRQSFGIPEDAFCLVLCSRAIPEKGWGRAVEICRRLASHGVAVHLLLIGGGPEADALRGANPLPDRIHVLGHVDTPMRLFRACDVGLFPSTYVGETFPLFLLECFGAGLPVVTTDIGEIPRMVGDAGTVVSHRLDDAAMIEQMVAGCMVLFDNPAVYHGAVTASVANAERYTMERLVSLYVDTFAECIAMHRDRSAERGAAV